MAGDIKFCTKCATNKNVAFFYKKKRTWDKLDTRCKACANQASREWQAANPDRIKLINARRRDKAKWTPAYIALCADARLRTAAWDKANPEKKAEKNRKRVLDLPDSYVAAHHLGMPLASTPQELIILKREHIILRRLTRDLAAAIGDGCGKSNE